MKQKKLQLNKEIVAKLKKDEMQNVFGGVEITAAITQGPGCLSVREACIIYVKNPPVLNPVTTYCASGYVQTCVRAASCGTDIWC